MLPESGRPLSWCWTTKRNYSLIRAINMLEGRIHVVGVFEDRRGALDMATAIILRACRGPGPQGVQGHGIP